MTSFAAQLSAARARTYHSIVKLPIVRVAMARCAGTILKTILGNFSELRRHPRLVAINASHRKMSARQIESGLPMHCQRERGWPEALEGVACLTPILIRSSSKLPTMLVFMAVGAGGELNLVQRCSTGRNVALRTGDGSMFSFQWIRRGRVFFQSKLGRLESLNGVTCGAFPTISAL
jgi:hypothetical protein